jgi:transposase
LRAASRDARRLGPAHKNRRQPAGHDDGAENWAILASLIETCKLNGIEPQAYLADFLVRLVNLWPNNRRDELLPRTWAATREQQQRAA